MTNENKRSRGLDALLGRLLDKRIKTCTLTFWVVSNNVNHFSEKHICVCIVFATYLFLLCTIFQSEWDKKGGLKYQVYSFIQFLPSTDSSKIMKMSFGRSNLGHWSTLQY